MSPNLHQVVQDQSESKLIVINSSIDDCGLSPSQFRVLGHLARRAGDGSCWASADTISKICRINRDTVWAALDVLEKRRIITREKRPGKTNLIRINKPSEWHLTDLAEKDGWVPVSADYPAERRGLHPAEKSGHEGYPSEGVPEKESQKVVSSLRSDTDGVTSVGKSVGKQSEHQQNPTAEPLTLEAIPLANSQSEFAPFQNPVVSPAGGKPKRKAKPLAAEHLKARTALDSFADAYEAKNGRPYPKNSYNEIPPLKSFFRDNPKFDPNEFGSIATSVWNGTDEWLKPRLVDVKTLLYFMAKALAQHKVVKPEYASAAHLTTPEGHKPGDPLF